jgi:ubiquinone/menaquinone biosynthesis C-methylase UbiE
MPQTATRKIFREVRRLVKQGGHFTLMDMNPQSPVYLTMSPHIMTLLKSTEPFMDQYFALDLETELRDAGFESVAIIPSSPRHRTVIAG